MSHTRSLGNPFRAMTGLTIVIVAQPECDVEIVPKVCNHGWYNRFAKTNKRAKYRDNPR